MHIIGIYKKKKIIFSLNSLHIILPVIFTNENLLFDIFSKFYKKVI